MRYVENGVREDFGKITLKGLRVPLCRLDEEEYLEVVFGRKSSVNHKNLGTNGRIYIIDAEGG